MAQERWEQWELSRRSVRVVLVTPSSETRSLLNTSSFPANPKREHFLAMALTGYRILVASNTDRITSIFFDPYGPTLNVTSEIIVGPHPTWITGHPTNPSLAFTGLEQQDGVIVVLTFDDTAKGTIVGQIPSGGASPASLLATTDALFVGNVRTTPPKPFARVTRFC